MRRCNSSGKRRKGLSSVAADDADVAAIIPLSSQQAPFPMRITAYSNKRTIGFLSKHRGMRKADADRWSAI